jgi:hypothetical protein
LGIVVIGQLKSPTTRNHTTTSSGYKYPPIMAYRSNRFLSFFSCRTMADVKQATKTTDIKNTRLIAVMPDGDIASAKHKPPKAPKRQK